VTETLLSTLIPLVPPFSLTLLLADAEKTVTVYGHLVQGSVAIWVGANVEISDAGVNQLRISGNTITSGQTGATVAVGAGSLTVPVFAGAFDNKYFTAASASSVSDLLHPVAGISNYPAF